MVTMAAQGVQQQWQAHGGARHCFARAGGRAGGRVATQLFAGSSCRLAPACSDKERSRGDREVWGPLGANTVGILEDVGMKVKFAYDYVFDGGIGNQTVYKTIGSRVVKSSMDGINGAPARRGAGGAVGGSVWGQLRCAEEGPQLAAFHIVVVSKAAAAYCTGVRMWL